MSCCARFLLLIIAIFSAITPVQAAAKENLVLMPLRVATDEKDLRGVMEAALVNGLQQKYKVYSGEEVAQKAKVIFDKESSTKKTCDETRCMQDIALAFNAELIATATVQKQNDGYFLALKIQNIMDNTVVQSESLPCEGCNAYAVVDKLKELVGTAASAQPASTEVKPVQAVSGNDAETEIWKTLEASESVDDYQAYVDEYPKGKYAFLAKARIKKLQAAVVSAEQNETRNLENMKNLKAALVGTWDMVQTCAYGSGNSTMEIIQNEVGGILTGDWAGFKILDVQVVGSSLIMKAERTGWRSNSLQIQGKFHDASKITGTYTQSADNSSCQWEAAKR